MLKQEFLDALRQGLSGLPQADVEERLTFYGEMIDDRIEEGCAEEEAVAQAGTVEEIVSQTVADVPLTRIVKETIRPKRRMRAWEIVLLVVGFPLWFPLLVAAGAVMLSLYIVLWALVIVLWTIEVSLWACALASFAAAVVYFVNGHTPNGIAAFGAALIFAGLSLFLLFGCVAASKGAAKLAKKIVLGIKSLFIRKERAK